jgi:hypothetical protein
MGVGAGVRGFVAAGVVAATFVVGAGAQTSVQLSEPGGPLLPASFGQWRTATPENPLTPPVSLTTTNKDALEECGPQRSQVANYQRGGGSLHVEAIEFADRTGAYSAYTLVKRASMREGKLVGTWESIGDGVLVLQQGSTLVLAYPVALGGGSDGADVKELKALADILPKVPGNKGVAPLLPTLVPADGLVAGSLRYALGPQSYAIQGGVLPMHSLEWDKSAEAVTALYSDKRGKETVTVLLYPTPTIAGQIARSIKDEAPQMGPAFASARVRREGPLVVLASGGFSGDEAQRMVDTIHLRQDVAMDKVLGGPVFETEVVKTYSLLTSIAVLAGVLMLAAVLLGLFLGVGRATFRVMRGKPAAAEPEFLSLHLAPQNEAPKFGGQ